MVEPRSDGFDFVLRLAIARQRDEGQTGGPRFGSQAARHLASVDIRHANIEQRNVWLMLDGKTYRLRAAMRHPHFMTREPE